MFKGIMIILGLLVLNGSATAQQERITLSVNLPPYLTLMADFFDPFEAQFPQVEVIVRSVDMNTLMIAGEYEPLTIAENYTRQADVLMVATDFRAMPTLDLEATLAGYYLDLKPLIQSDSALDPALYTPSVWEAFQWSQGFWAIPAYYELEMLHYDPHWLAELQLFPPDASLSLSEWEQLLNGLATAEVPLLDVSGGIEAIVWSLVGGGWLDLSASPPAITVDRVKLATILESSRHWRIAQPQGEITFTDYPLIYGPADLDLPGYESALPPGGHSTLTVTGLAVRAGTSHPELAYELAKYLAHSPQLNSFGDQMANQMPEGLLVQAMENAWVIPFGSLINVLDLAQNPALTAEMMIDEAIITLESALAAGVARRESVNFSVDPLTVNTDAEAIRFGVDHNLLMPEVWQRIATNFQTSHPDLPPIVIASPQFKVGDVVNPTAYAEQFDCFYSRQPLRDPAWLALTPWMQADPRWLERTYAEGVLAPLSMDGQLWGYPLSLHPLMLFYDETVITTPPITITELERLLVDHGPLQLPTYPLEAILMFAGGYGADSADFTMMTPETVGALERVLRLAREGHIQYTGFDSSNWQEATASFILASIDTPLPVNYVASLFVSPIIALDIGVGYISATSTYTQECYQFLAYLAEDRSLFAIPAYTGETSLEFVSMLYTGLNEGQITLLPISTGLDMVSFYRKTMLYRLFDQAVIDPSLELAPALEQLEERLATFLGCINPLDPMQATYLDAFLRCVAPLQQAFES